jgi:hypothetical protein
LFILFWKTAGNPIQTGRLAGVFYNFSIIKIGRKMDKRLIAFLIGFFFISFTSHAQNKQEKKLIEFGWDYPTSTFIEHNIERMQQSPFDGVVFSFDAGIYNAFDPVKLADPVFDLNVLSNIHWQKLTDNFLFVRGVGLSGPHWLDDSAWNIILQNLTNLSKALAVSKAKGIGFDPEYNYKDPKINSWSYSPSLYNGLSYEEVGKWVRKRGKQFISALQTYKPDVKILCFWLLALVYDQSNQQPLSQTGMALYPFFIDGLLEGKNSSSEIIDGNESSYWYQDFQQFVNAGRVARENQIKLIDDSLHNQFKNIPMAQSVFFDGLFALAPRFEKGFDQATKERWLRDNLYLAFKTTDEYVWFYSERINWWKSTVDARVVAIINSVKNRIETEQNNTSAAISGQSYVPGFKNEQLDDYHGFHYNYRRKANSIEIKLLNLDVQAVSVYENSRLIDSFQNPPTEFKITLTKKLTLGNIIIVSSGRGGNASAAFVN